LIRPPSFDPTTASRAFVTGPRPPRGRPPPA
jgi:hypothetical protein